ncbi:hypothetical protein [Streptomyces sp. NPDC046942]|uniref:AraC-like ligand-binding domain-containing protein n=1 Tax=Streptomyces sp. NPDC046942 TaxID=3155137 RepID=UPI00340C086C
MGGFRPSSSPSPPVRPGEVRVNSAHPLRVVGDASERFRATVRMLDPGAVNVVALALSPCEVARTPELIRQADPKLCSVIVPLDGTLVVSQAGRDMALGAHELALYDSSPPVPHTVHRGGRVDQAGARTYAGRCWGYPPMGWNDHWRDRCGRARGSRGCRPGFSRT